MLNLRWSALGALAALALAAAPAPAAEWFVKAGATGNGETKETPAGDLAAVLKECRRGDVVHVAQGEYHGRANSGEFRVDVPNLTLVGGWDDAFAKRDPFTQITLLRRAPGLKTGVNYTNTLGGVVAVEPDAHGEGRVVSASGLIVDGFVIDGSTRNGYNNLGQLAAQGSWKESLIKLTAAHAYTTVNLKFRNCVLINCYNMGIENKWQGPENEISNCLLVGNMIAGIDLRNVQPAKINAPAAPDLAETTIAVRNCTVAYNWDHDKAQMACGVLMPGSGEGKVVLENNVFAWMTGVNNAAVRGARPKDVIRGNVFHVTGDGKALVDGQATAAQMGGGRRRGEEEEEEEGGGGASGGPNVADNVVADPGFDARVDKEWFTSFTGFAGVFGKAPIEVVDAARAKQGLPPVGKVGAAMAPQDKAWGKAYPTTDVPAMLKTFVADQAGKGFRTDAPLATYASREEPDLVGAVGGKAADYREITFDDLYQGGANAPKEGEKVKLKVNLRGELANRWAHLPFVNQLDYLHFEVGKPGVTGNTPDRFFAYAVRGGQAGQRYNELGGRAAIAPTKDGVWVRGTIYPTSQPANNKVRWVMVIDFLGKP